MHQITNIINAITTMTSREMADLTEKRHDNVKRTIDTLVEKGVISHPQIEDGPKSGNGVIEVVYLVGKRDSYVIVAQLSPEFTARIVDRWQKLEADVAAPALPNFSDPVAAARAWADAVELSQHLAITSAASEAKLAIAAPKAEALDLLTLADGAMCITNAAKAVSKQPKALFAWLQAHDWIYRRPGGVWCAYQPRIKSGLLTHKVTTVSRSDGTEKIVEQVLVTAKGLAKLAEAAA